MSNSIRITSNHPCSAPHGSANTASTKKTTTTKTTNGYNKPTNEVNKAWYAKSTRLVSHCSIYHATTLEGQRGNYDNGAYHVNHNDETETRPAKTDNQDKYTKKDDKEIKSELSAEEQQSADANDLNGYIFDFPCESAIPEKDLGYDADRRIVRIMRMRSMGLLLLVIMVMYMALLVVLLCLVDIESCFT